MRAASLVAGVWGMWAAGVLPPAPLPGDSARVARDARVADACESRTAAVRAALSAERAAQLAGASDADGPAMEFEPALRDCFEHDVVPKLKAAENDDLKIQPAFEAATAWFRQAQLLGFGEDDFAAEWRTVYTHLTTAFTNGYAKAKARCRTTADVEAARKMRALFAGSAILPGGGEELFPTFEADIARCLRGVSYLITVNERTVAEKIGTIDETRYRATVAPKPGEPDEMEGTGSYSGYTISVPNCEAQTGKWLGEFHRLPAAGRVSAWAQIADLSLIGGSRNTFQVILSTLDWPYKPMFFSRRDAVATGEDREAVAGLGTIAHSNIALTGRTTSHASTESREGGSCAGTVTATTQVTIVRLGGR